MKICELEEAIVDPQKAKEYTKAIDIPKAMAIAETHCSDALNTYISTGKSLFKGFTNWSNNTFENNFYAIDSSQIARKSQNTVNVYTYFTSNISTEWKQYPRRDRSLICSTSTRYASRYGTIFCVFPENGTKIGVCPSFDMWASFENNNIYSAGDFARFIGGKLSKWTKKEGMIDQYSYYSEDHLDYLVPDFLKLPLKYIKIGGAIADHYDTYNINKILKKHKGITIGEYMEIVLNPDNNGFSLITPNQIASAPGTESEMVFSKGAGSGNGREAWFSGRCVIANKNALDYLIKQGKKK